MKPALTKEEWANFDPDNYGEIECVMNTEPDGDHKAAAMLLFGKPFGFTREHVEMLRCEAEIYWKIADPEEYGVAEKARGLDSLADLIEAKLPPEES